MHFERRFVLVVSVSLAWALLVSGAFYRLAGGAKSRTRAAAQKQVVVATRPLTVGMTLDRDSVKLRAVPEDLFPAGAFSRLADVLDRPVISAIQADEPVIEARLAVRGSGMGLGPLIPPGMRAISVRVNDVVGVAGFVLPGMRVDVLVTGKPPNRDVTETQTVLQNITVLSAGQTIQTDGRNQPIMTPVVTLLVNPEEAEALTLANIEGRIQLVLRNSTDRAETATRGRRLHDLYGSAPPGVPTGVQAGVQGEAAPRKVRGMPAGPPVAKRVEAPPIPLVAQSVPEPQQMIVIRGAVKKIEIFGRGEVAK